jgi:hypothetical protein
MNIKEFSDEEILDFLMTSEFHDNYSPDELKNFLIKWRYFYRLHNGKFERFKCDSEFLISKLESKVDSLNRNILLLESKNIEKQEQIDYLKNRKLSWKERFFGKVKQ